MIESLSFQERCALWHRAKFPSGTPELKLVKLTEEVGELARAFIADLEGRSGRGDVGDEAAQCVLVLASFIGCHYPHRDLLADAMVELRRHERALDGPGLWSDTTPCCQCGSTLGAPWEFNQTVPECAHCHHVCGHPGYPFRFVDSDGSSG